MTGSLQACNAGRTLEVAMDAKIPWKSEYEAEAHQIAADVVFRRGFRWKAHEILAFRRPRCEEVELVMQALMVARGDIEAPKSEHRIRASAEMQRRLSRSTE